MANPRVNDEGWCSAWVTRAARGCEHEVSRALAAATLNDQIPKTLFASTRLSLNVPAATTNGRAPGSRCPQWRACRAPVPPRHRSQARMAQAPEPVGSDAAAAQGRVIRDCQIQTEQLKD